MNIKFPRSAANVAVLLLGQCVAVAVLTLAPGRPLDIQAATSPDALRDTATRLFDQGKLRAAVPLYEQALKLYLEQAADTEAAVVRHQLGFAYLGSNDAEKALAQFRENLDYHQKAGHRSATASYYLYAAQALFRLQRFSEAVLYLDRGARLVKKEPQRFLEMKQWQAKAYLAMHVPDKAADVVREALAAFSPDLVRPYFDQIATSAGIDIKQEAATYDREFFVTHPLATALTAGLILMMTLLHVVDRWRKFRPHAWLILGSTAFALGLAEWLLRTFFDPADVRHKLHPPNQITEFHPLPGIMPGIDYQKSRFSTNSMGLRGHLPPRFLPAYRILAIGGSSTEGLFLDDEDAWPLLLENHLNAAGHTRVWVGNAGKSGLNIFSHFVQTDVYLDEIRPDLILLTAGINDLNQCISGGINAIVDNRQRLESADFTSAYSRHVFYRIDPQKNGFEWKLAKLVAGAFRSLSGSGQATSLPQYDFVVQDQAGLFYETQRQRRLNAEQVDTIPHIEVCLNSYEFVLEKIITLTRQHGIRLVLATQGALYKTIMPEEERKLLWFGAVDENPFAPSPPQRYFSHAVMRVLLDRYNARTLALCSRYRLPCFDTDRYLPRSTAVYYDDVHLNIRGSKRLARALSRFILRSGLLPIKGRHQRPSGN